MSSSIKTGLAAEFIKKEHLDAAFIMLCDQPLVATNYDLLFFFAKPTIKTIAAPAPPSTADKQPMQNDRSKHSEHNDTVDRKIDCLCKPVIASDKIYLPARLFGQFTHNESFTTRIITG